MAKKSVIVPIVLLTAAGLGLFLWKGKNLLSTAKNLYWEIKGISGLKMSGTSLSFTLKMMLRSHSQTQIQLKNIVVSLLSEDSQKSRSVISTPAPIPQEYTIHYGDTMIEIPLQFNLVKIALAVFQNPTFIVAINAQVEGISLPQVEYGFTIKQVTDTAKNVVISALDFFKNLKKKPIIKTPTTV